MATPFVGEIRIFAGRIEPSGWKFCNGQLLEISLHNELWTLILTTYGRDCTTYFALPNLQASLPIHMGTGADGITYNLAEKGGADEVTLKEAELAPHTHSLYASSAVGSSPNPATNVSA